MYHRFLSHVVIFGIIYVPYSKSFIYPFQLVTPFLQVSSEFPVDAVPSVYMLVDAGVSLKP